MRLHFYYGPILLNLFKTIGQHWIILWEAHLRHNLVFVMNRLEQVTLDFNNYMKYYRRYFLKFSTVWSTRQYWKKGLWRRFLIFYYMIKMGLFIRKHKITKLCTQYTNSKISAIQPNDKFWLGSNKFLSHTKYKSRN